MAVRTDAQIRASAQRKLARELKTGVFKPSPIGKKAREAANKYKTERAQLIAKIQEYKSREYTNKVNRRTGTVLFHQRRSNKSIGTSPITGKARPIEQLRTIADVIDQAERDELDMDWIGELFDDDDYQSGLYYH